ncbi:MAG TPA: cache domain-containing protein, partial [Anaerolineales bacterium]|nr:cache domain-containing protein [Anaerolineales bacterium]
MRNESSSPNPSPRGGIAGRSFRSRLRWSMLAMVGFAMIATAAYIVYRAYLINTYLIGQVNESVTLQAEKEISSLAARRALELDNYFVSVNNSMESLGKSIQLMFDQRTPFTASWNAKDRLTQLAQGSWDNSNDEPGSIFVPKQSALPDKTLEEINTLKQIDILAPAVLSDHPDMIALYFGGAQGETLYYPNVDLANILPPDFDITQRPWYLAAEPGANPERSVVWSAPYVDAALNGYVVTSSTPVFDGGGRFRGVVASDLQLTSITKLISSIRVEQSGYAFLIDNKGRLIAMPEAGYADFGLSASDFQGDAALDPILPKVQLDVFQALLKMTLLQSDTRVINVNGVEKYLAYQPLPSVGYSVGIVVPVNETQTALLVTQQRLENEAKTTLI